MKDVVIDTNFLILALKYRIDIKEELTRILPFMFRIDILDKSLLELKKLTESPKTQLEALLALKLSATFHLLRSLDGSVDDNLVRLSENKQVIIATNDKELKERLKGKYIVIRNMKIFELKG